MMNFKLVLLLLALGILTTFADNEVSQRLFDMKPSSIQFFEVASSLEFTFTPSSVQVQTVQMTPSPVIDACSSNPCDQICTVIDGGFECSCMEGFVLESDGTTCEELMILELQNRVSLTLIGETRKTFTQEKQYLFRNATARAMNNYCRQNPDDCDIILVTTDDGARKRLIPRTLIPLFKRQESASVSANDIIIISIVNITGGLQVTFFVRIMSGVVSAQAIADAVQEAIDDGVYSTAGFTATDVIIVVTPSPTPQDNDDDDGLSGGQIAGIVIGVVVGVLLLLVIIILLVYCLWRKKNSKQHSFHENVPQTDDEFALKKDPFSREGQASVHSVKMTFIGGDDEEGEKKTTA